MGHLRRDANALEASAAAGTPAPMVITVKAVSTQVFPPPLVDLWPLAKRNLDGRGVRAWASACIACSGPDVATNSRSPTFGGDSQIRTLPAAARVARAFRGRRNVV